MFVTSIIIILVITSLFLPKSILTKYSWICVLILSLLWFRFNPPFNYDLYRHYESLRIYGSIMLSDVFAMDGRYYDNYLAYMYLKSYPVYSLFAFLIAKIGIKELLVVIATFIVYSSVFVCINCMENDNISKWKYVFSIMSVLFSINYLGCSGIRNMMAVCIFHMALFYELVERKNRIACWVVYAACCLIHSQAIIFLGLRGLLFLYNRFTKNIMKIALIFGISIFTIMSEDILSLFKHNRFLSNIISRALYLFNLYNEGGTQYTDRYLQLCMFLYIVMFVICAYSYNRLDINSHKKWSRYYDYLVILMLVTISSVAYSDIFARFNTLFTPMFIIMSNLFIRTNGGPTPLSVHKDEKNISKSYIDLAIIVIIYGVNIIYLLSNYILRYKQMDQYFKF